MPGLMEKLAVLGEAARYDASCASSGSGRQGKRGGLGNSHMAGICHTWTEDGRCVSLFKVLLSNCCAYDCAYCVNRSSNDCPRATFEPEELAELTVEFYRRNYIEGLFLSSAVIKNPDCTMERLLRTVSLLRGAYRFHGYIHVKVIPSADARLIRAIGLLADRISVNIELPSSQSLALLAPQKTPQGILTPMRTIRNLKEENALERKEYRHAPLFAPAGQSTQLIVGATRESDGKILRLSEGLYRQYGLKRIYFSAYVPIGTHPALPDEHAQVPLAREHRLYQADWLMRFYGFQAGEILGDGESLDLEMDPKCAWALRHPEVFPVEVNRADWELLLRVPGVGRTSASRIVNARRSAPLSLDDLRALGVVMKRARYFVTAAGRFGGRMGPDNPLLRELLTENRVPEQLTLFGDVLRRPSGPAILPTAPRLPARSGPAARPPLPSVTEQM